MDFFSNFRYLSNIPYARNEKWDICSFFFDNIEIKNSPLEIKGAYIEIDENGFFDVVDLYEQIVELLKTQNKNTCVLNKEKLEWIVNNSKEAQEIRLAKDELFKLDQNIQNVDQISKFKSRADKILSELREACKESYCLLFAERILYINQSKKSEQQNLLSMFLSICQEYISVRTSNKNILDWNCCDNPKILFDGCMNYCANCPNTFAPVDAIGAFNDQKRIATNAKPNKYYNIKHFVSAIKKSQGIHKKNIDPSLDTKQDEYMQHHNIKLKDYTVFDLMDLLTRDSSLSSYYKDVHLIYRQKTGKQVNNLTNVERELPKWYKEQDKFSDTIKLKIDSKNSINAYYMVCRLAQLKGGRIDLKLKNFFCAKDQKTIDEYDSCFEKRCLKLGWLREGEKLLEVVGEAEM